MSSRLFTEVREKRGLCYTVYAVCHSLRNRGGVFGYAGTTAERAQETLDVMLAEFDRLSSGCAAGGTRSAEGSHQAGNCLAAGIEPLAGRRDRLRLVLPQSRPHDAGAIRHHRRPDVREHQQVFGRPSAARTSLSRLWGRRSWRFTVQFRESHARQWPGDRGRMQRTGVLRGVCVFRTHRLARRDRRNLRRQPFSRTYGVQGNAHADQRRREPAAGRD